MATKPPPKPPTTDELLQQLIAGQNDAYVPLTALAVGLTPFQAPVVGVWPETKAAVSALKAVDLAALRLELLNDPGGLGYAPLVAVGNTDGLATIINLVRSGTAADGKSYSILRNDIQPKEVVNAIANADFVAATQIMITKLQFMFVAGVIDVTLPNVLSNMQSIFSAASQATKDALTALSTRNGSRAEVLFGIGTVVTSAQIAQALK